MKRKHAPVNSPITWKKLRSTDIYIYICVMFRAVKNFFLKLFLKVLCNAGKLIYYVYSIPIC